MSVNLYEVENFFPSVYVIPHGRTTEIDVKIWGENYNFVKSMHITEQNPCPRVLTCKCIFHAHDAILLNLWWWPYCFWVDRGRDLLLGRWPHVVDPRQLSGHQRGLNSFAQRVRWDLKAQAVIHTAGLLPRLITHIEGRAKILRKTIARV